MKCYHKFPYSSRKFSDFMIELIQETVMCVL
jgi:hypothetical protein